MRHRILQHGRLLPALEARLAERYALHPLWSESDPQGFLAAHGGEFEGLVTSARFGADAALTAAMPALKIISSFGVGLAAMAQRLEENLAAYFAGRPLVSAAAA